MSTTYSTTRHSLHGAAELLVAGPRYAAGGSMRLRAGADGILAWDEPPVLLTAGTLVVGSRQVPLDGSTYVEAGEAAGLVAHPLDDVYHDGPHVAPTDVIELDPDAAQVVVDSLARGNRGLRALVPSAEPVLWPEHFDVAISVDGVNYGVSPGDGFLDEPYAYVGPHEPRSGAFWNAPFGAVRALADVVDDESLVAFFDDGRRAAAG
jgi:hypothetical protein